MLGRRVQSRKRLPKARPFGRGPRRKTSPAALHSSPLPPLPQFPHNLFTDFGDHTHVASSEARDWLTHDAHVPTDRISLIPHGVDVERSPSPTNPPRLVAQQCLRFRPTILLPFTSAGWIIPSQACRMAPSISSISRRTNPQSQAAPGRRRPAGTIPPRADHPAESRGPHASTGHREPLPPTNAADALLPALGARGFSLVCAEAMSVGVPCLRTRTSRHERADRGKCDRPIRAHRSRRLYRRRHRVSRRQRFASPHGSSRRKFDPRKAHIPATTRRDTRPVPIHD